mmetsp:Transcript_25295/g.58741  ORF Transcript_25295/g.58741 Transcript_25295/m.58741 type:complete len:245 (+) Transcript_25295:103-837(+)
MSLLLEWAKEEPSSVDAAKQGISHVLLVRHGETDWNAEGRMQGQLDVALNDAGRQQARRFGQHLVRLGIAPRISAVVSSDLSRAKETADIIAEVCSNPERQLDPRLREVSTGDLQGLLVKDVQSKIQAVKAAWDRGDFSCAYPGGESADLAMLRGLKALDDAAQLGSVVLVVAHGGVMRLSAIGIELCGVQITAASLASPKAAKVKQAPITNCCCSLLSYDHHTQMFAPRFWFERIESALDDTG